MTATQNNIVQHRMRGTANVPSTIMMTARDGTYCRVIRARIATSPGATPVSGDSRINARITIAYADEDGLPCQYETSAAMNNPGACDIDLTSGLSNPDEGSSPIARSRAHSVTITLSEDFIATVIVQTILP